MALVGTPTPAVTSTCSFFAGWFTEVPRTISGKKVELAVTRMLRGEAVDNRDALANPASLDQFVDLPELRIGLT